MNRLEWIKDRDRLKKALTEAVRAELGWSMGDGLAAIDTMFRDQRRLVTIGSRPRRVKFFVKVPGSGVRAKSLNRYLADFPAFSSLRADSLNRVVDHTWAGLVEISSDHFTLVHDKDIVKAYAEGYGQSSCMTGPNRQFAVELYGYPQNRDKVQLVKYHDGNGYRARALLWTADCGTRLLDRIYPCSGWHVSIFHKWAKENNILVRSSGGYDDDEVCQFGSDRTVYKVSLFVGRSIPYMDSMSTFETEVKKNSVATFSNGPPNTSVVRSAFSTSGYFDDLVTCCHCDQLIEGENNRVTGMYQEQYCKSCWGTLFAYCHCCESVIYINEPCYRCSS